MCVCVCVCVYTYTNTHTLMPSEQAVYESIFSGV